MFLKSSVLLNEKPHSAVTTYMGITQMNVFKYICFFSVCLLTACAPPKMAQEQPTDNLKKSPTSSELNLQKKPTLAASSVSSWEISGAMAARNSKKGWTAHVNWLQEGANHYQIRLFGPLGGGTIIIEKKGAVITYADGPKKISSHSADQLLQQQTGIRLPVSNLYYWVRGLPAPGALGATHHDSNKQLMSLSQAGYTIQYANYTTVNNVSLPGKIMLQGHEATIKFVIKRWRI